MAPTFLTLRQVSDELDLTRCYIYELAKRAGVPSVMDEQGNRIFTAEEVERIRAARHPRRQHTTGEDRKVG